MNVLFAATECVPFAKTGGLGDVIGDLPRDLPKFLLPKGRSRVLTVLPKYLSLDAKKFGLEKVPGKIQVPMGSRTEEGRIWRKGDVYFIENKSYFDRSGLYGYSGGDYLDNDERFGFFCRGVFELCKLIGFQPDIIHGHDWQTGLIPAYLKTIYYKDPLFSKTATVFTIHNIAYQGIFPKQRLKALGFGADVFTPDKLEYYDQICFLKSGIVFSDRVTTVSPRYAVEIQSGNHFGRGMEGILKARSKSLAGILNGLDENIWNPLKDSMIAAKYSPLAAQGLQKKLLCKHDLQKTAGLAKDASAPLVGIVSRLDPQKGFKMICEVLPKISGENPKIQWVILGSGDPKIKKDLEDAAKKFPGRISFSSEFNNPLAHKIYAGSDIFLMPSEYEPCGLGQMISMKYGTIPVVTPTGGLMDTVRPWNDAKKTGNGFVCGEISSASLLKEMRRALKIFQSPAAWKKLIKNAAASDFSWTKSTASYAKLYSEVLAKKNKRG